MTSKDQNRFYTGADRIHHEDERNEAIRELAFNKPAPGTVIDPLTNTVIPLSAMPKHDNNYTHIFSAVDRRKEMVQHITNRYYENKRTTEDLINRCLTIINSVEHTDVDKDIAMIALKEITKCQ